MELKKLGNSDLKVSPYCLGTMTFGETTSEKDAHLQIDESLNAGINFIDTAEMYPTCPIRKETTGSTEKIIGNWIGKNKHKRNVIILATKVVGNGYKFIRDGGKISKKTINLAVEESLKKLKTDYIDLYQLHWPNRGSYHFRAYWDYYPKKQNQNRLNDEITEIVEALYSLKKKGIIREFGLSNETCWGTMKYVQETRKYDGLFVTSIQNEYSLMCRLFDNDFNELSVNENIPLLAYSPLARGLLTGKYLGKNIPHGSRLSRDDKIRKIVNAKSDLAVRDYCELSKKFDLDPVHLALSFCKERPFMGSVIFGATNIVQVRRILKGLDIKLGEEIKDDIQKLYKRYPLTF